MIAIIPARGGSKGLPNKNIKVMLDKPLIAHTILSAKKCRYISRVIVTTDSEEIAKIARAYGAEVPFMRPIELATDKASAIDTYLHATEYMRDVENENVDKFIVLLPTAPLRTSEDINKAVEYFKMTEAKTLISMVEADIPISWFHKINKQGRVENAGFENAGFENAITNRQEYQKYYVPNGAIYILDYDLLKKKRTYYCENTVAYIMSTEKSIDIDTALDFEFAEYMMKRQF